MKLSEFSQAQQEFLAVLDAFSKPVAIDVASTLAPLSAAELVSLIHQATRAGWLNQIDATHIALTSKIPDPTIAKLRKRNTPSRCRFIIETLKKFDLYDGVAPDTLFKLLHKSGEKRAAAVIAHRMALEEIDKHHYRSAYYYQYQAIFNFMDILGEDDINRLFFLSVLSLSDLADNFWYTEYIGQDEDTHDKMNLLDILNRAKEAAKRFEHHRQLALIRLHLARHYINLIRYQEALDEFNKGFESIEQYDDEEINTESTVFYGHYYFLQGRYKKAAAYYETLVSMEFHREGKPIDFRAPKAHCFCLWYLGQINHAIGLLDSYIKRSMLASMPLIALSFRIMLSSTLLFTDKRAEAYVQLKETIEEVKVLGRREVLLARLHRVLAYYYYLEGRIEDAYEYFKKGLVASSISQSVIMFLRAPAVLELFFEFEKRGYAPIQGIRLDNYLQDIINGPNIHFHGVAYRIMARQAQDKGADIVEIQAFLDKSLSSLKESGDLFETARTTAFLAQIELHRGNRAKANELALRAWEGLSVLAEDVLPFELKALIKVDKSQFRQKSSAVLKNYSDLLNDLLPSISKEEMLTRFMIMNCRIFKSERGALFIHHALEQKPPELIGAYNLTQVEIDDRDFHPKFKCVIKALKNEKIVLKRISMGRSGAGNRTDVDILCLPFSLGENISGALYLENRYSGSEYGQYDKVLLMETSIGIANYINRLMNISGELEKNTSLNLKPQLETKEFKERSLVAKSLVMKDMIQQADIAAQADAPVMILGETGVGKELIAKRIHLKSPREQNAFIDVNLASIPETLIESELFGHEKGAFTGANKQKKGYLELAHRGTFFIDEVGDIPHSIQVKLLRAIQEKSFYRVGGIRKISSDFRIITATNRDLKKMINKGSFREDMYYRLNVVQLSVPPLRERGDDIMLLAQHFIARFSKRYNLPVFMLSSGDVNELNAYHWPGNVRELENVIERAVILAGGDPSAFAIPALSVDRSTDTVGEQPSAFSDKPTLDEIQRRYIEYILQTTGGKLSGPDGAAQILGLKRSTLYHRMKSLGIR